MKFCDQKNVQNVAWSSCLVLSWFISHPTEHTGPPFDAIRVYQELPPLLAPRWTLGIFCRSLLTVPLQFDVVDLVLSCILESTSTVLAVVIQMQDMSKPVNSSFSRYVVHRGAGATRAAAPCPCCMGAVQGQRSALLPCNYT